MPAASAEQSPAESITFSDLALSEAVLKALADVGYESPSPIQAQTIPQLLAGRDMVGQAQTGTGKTAAFALPILSKIDLSKSLPQALVLAPTRELAVQVAEAFQRYAAHLKGFHVLPIYGGQSYEPQLRSLRRGAHVVVGTPGRVMDHMKRGTLKLDGLRHLVLDEADEMLHMGFIDDVEWILEHAPAQRQIALFSATMPPPIRRIAQTHLKSPAEITIRSRTSTATNIRQRYWVVSGVHKLDALTRILEAEAFDGMLIFARTKQSTTELAERLEARGFAAAALNGDIPQALRERTVARLKEGKLDIVVATDVAARGLDVERVSHVINYDIPYDTASYVHRIGRTGRAGRSGDAILFITPRERGLLRAIERATRQPIEQMELPTMDVVQDLRINRFKQKITDTLAAGELALFQSLVEQYEREHNVPMSEVAAALAFLAQGDKPLIIKTRESRREAASEAGTETAARPIETPGEMPVREAREERPREPRRIEARPPRTMEDRPRREERPQRETAPPRDRKPRPEFAPREAPREASEKREPPRAKPGRRSSVPMEPYRIEVGRMHGVKPGNIMGAIANEAGLEGEHIGHIEIREDHSIIELPEGMPRQIFRDLQKVWVSGQQLRISRAHGAEAPGDRKAKGKPRHSRR